MPIWKSVCILGPMTGDSVPKYFKRASALSHDEISLSRKIIAAAQPFEIYFNAAFEALENGQDNRWFYLCESTGLIMGVDFDGLRIFSLIGEIDDEILSVIGKNPRRTEFHIPDRYAVALKALGNSRFVKQSKLRYYFLRQNGFFQDDFSCLQRLSVKDLSEVKQFYSQHYSGTIFSSWMLEQPFFGLFAEGNLVAAGGTIAVDKVGEAANIGNFLTAPAFRGRGYGKLVAKRLINELKKTGIKIFTLGTTEENIAAWKTYEAVGFSLLKQITEIEFSAS
ncbi:MAG: GNAT family N-acetyltransferase [Bdellovibrionota bacterium]